MSVKNVLLLDDDEISNMVLGRMLSRTPEIANFRIMTNGWEAIEYLKTSDDFPQFIIVDLKMPEMDGFEFIERYQKHFFEQHPDTGVIVLTSSIREKDKERVFKYPCVIHFESKPIRENKLHKMIGISEPE